MADFSVYLDGSELSMLSYPDENRPEGCACAYEDEEGVHVEVYMNALNENHTIGIAYIVYNAVILHDDIAEFRWNLTSSSEPAAISSLTSHITIPYGSAENGLYIWAHGPKNGTFNKLAENGMVNEFSLSVNDVSKDTAVSVRMAMPLELFPDGSRHESGDALEAIIEYESKYENNENNGTVPEIISGIITAAAIISFVSIFTIAPLCGIINKKLLGRKIKKLRHTPVQSMEYCLKPPDELKPAMVGKLMAVYEENGKAAYRVKRDLFAATMLDLIERGVISFRGGDTPLFKVGEQLPVLTGSEKVLIDTLSTASGADYFDIEALNAYLNGNPSIAQEKRTAFDAAVQSEFDSYSFIEHHAARKLNKKVYWTLAAFFVAASAIIGAFSGLTDGWFASAAVEAVLAALTVFCLTLTKKLIDRDFDILTQQGEDRYALWSAYSRFLDNFTSFEETRLPEISMFRRSLVYAAALGKSRNILDELRVNFPDLYEYICTDDWWRYQTYFYSMIGKVETASYSVPDADYSGGGGGGFSSGGGGYDSGSSGGDFD